MRIALGCDHAGFAMKGVVAEALEADGHSILDLGTFSPEPVDYPDFARAVGNAVLRSFVDLGVLVCGSGVGASIAANKLRGIRAALCHDLFTARQSRQDDDANLLCLGARVLEPPLAVEITRAWLQAQFSGEERHHRRIAKIQQLENAPPIPAAIIASAAAPAAPERAPVPAAATRAPAPAPVAATPPRLMGAEVVAPPASPAPAAPRLMGAEVVPSAASSASAETAAPVAESPPSALIDPAPARGRSAAPAPPPARPAAAAASGPAPPRADAPRPEGPRPDTPRFHDPSLAARAAELIRQFTAGKEDDDSTGTPREGVISLDDEPLDDIVVLSEPSKPAAPARAPAAEGRPRPGAPAARPPAREAAARASAGKAEPAAKAPAAKGAGVTDLGALEPVREGLEVLEGQDFSGRLWMKDGTLWNGDVTEIRNRLGWLTAPMIMREHADDLRGFADEIRRLQYSHVVLVGMGGSALAAEMFTTTFGSKMGFPDLLVVDTTDPGAVKRVAERINPGRTMFVVSTKSGTTLETLDLYQVFRGVVEAGHAPRPGSQFIAITDAGTPLEQLATEAAFRRTFLNPPTIGGRYSALSFFGLVPAALIGVDVKGILTRATAMMEACAAETAAADNPGLQLGAALAGYARLGRDKVTLVFSEQLRALGSWIEQLLAESLGKDGKGLVPVDAEPLGAPAVYGQDRLFVAVCLPGDTTHDAALSALEQAGHPVLRLAVADPQEIGAECFRWMLATAAAGALLGVNPFDGPDVTAAKERTAALLGDHRRTRKLPDWPLDVEQDGLALSMGGGPRASDVAAGLWSHLTQAQPGDYLAIQAYLTPQAESWTQLQALRVVLRDRFRLATTVAWGPRYLHSTGQLHKGGPPSGLFLQVTGDDPEDVPVPGAGHGLATVKAAQALADAEALRSAGRRIARVHLRGKAPQALARLVKLARELSKSG